MTATVMSECASFHERLLACARRIAGQSGEGLLDLPALWKGFLYLARLESDGARKELDARWPGLDWGAHTPVSIPNAAPATLRQSPEVIRLLGPLGVLNKKFGGCFTEDNFISAIDSINAWHQLGFETTGVQRDLEKLVKPSMPGDEPPTAAVPKTSKPITAPESSTENREEEASSLPAASLAAALSDLRERLESEVYGQTAAVRAFADGLRAALDRPAQSGRLGGSFLVLGPNGCGKGEMIRVLEDWTRQHKALLRTKRVVRCEGFLPHSLPTLHLDIRGGDTGFLVFSEFEKYDTDVRDVLMDGLDRAVLQLPKGGRGERLESTPIHGWIVILIGNVGRALWGRLPFKEQNLLPDREHIREALEQEAIADSHRKDAIFAKSLSRSFLDRLDFFNWVAD